MTLTEDIETAGPGLCEVDEKATESKGDDQTNRDKVENTSSPKTHRCPYEGCTASFGKRNRLETHIRVNHTSYLPFRCPREGCGSDFACQTYLNKHLVRHDRPKGGRKPRAAQSDCTLCSQTFRSKHQLRTHQLRAHAGEVEVPAYVCDKCGASFALRSRLTVHERRHRGYKCSYPECNYTVDKWSELRKHLASNHKKLECCVCGKRYSNTSNLKVHIESVHQELQHHDEEDDTDRVQYPCPNEDCDRVYQRQSSLRTHIRTFHAPEPRFACPHAELCGRRFRHKKSLEQHLRLLDHTKPELFAAKVNEAEVLPAEANKTPTKSTRKRKRKTKTSAEEEKESHRRLKRKLKRMKPLIDGAALEEVGLAEEGAATDDDDDGEDEVEVDIDDFVSHELMKVRNETGE